MIIDAADDMNTQAANALLKMLEEPPERCTLLLITHQPSRLLPTIRSRCRTLRLGTLNGEQMHSAMVQAEVEADANAAALAELSGGSVGEAMRLSLLGGLQIYTEIVGILGSLPNMDRARTLRLAEAAAQRGAEEKLDLLFTLLEIALAPPCPHRCNRPATPDRSGTTRGLHHVATGQHASSRSRMGRRWTRSHGTCTPWPRGEP